MDTSSTKILEFFDVKSANFISSEVVDLCGNEFLWQDDLSKSDLVRPIETKVLPQRIDFCSDKSFTTFFELFSLASCCIVAQRDCTDSRVAAYCSLMSLWGVAQYQTPDATEFSFREICLVFSNAIRELKIHESLREAYLRYLNATALENSTYFCDYHEVDTALKATIEKNG